MSEEIVKAYLLQTDLVEVTEDLSNSKFDFVVMSKKDISKVIAVEVKASSYSGQRLLKHYIITRKSLLKCKFPAMIFYVNSLAQKGSFEVINKQLNDTLVELSPDKLKKEIKNLFMHY